MKFRIAVGSPKGYRIWSWIFSFGYHKHLTVYIRFCGVLFQWYQESAEWYPPPDEKVVVHPITGSKFTLFHR